MQTPRDAVSKLIYELAKLPGVGEKTAMRLSYFILKQDISYAQALSESILMAKEQIGLCAQCFNLTDKNPCVFCSDTSRDRSLLCIVEKPTDVTSIENSSHFKGYYHVLHGALSPLDGIGPEELKIKELLKKLTPIDSATESSIKEVILAMNPSVEGESTALYISRLLAQFSIKTSQLAFGIQVGGLLEYTDRQTIGRALQNRVVLKQ